ncbi:glucokinase [Falsiroseomonas tokyonensis]|uniref:Glucokinase n=1 Tax=Falsiroseomonas tokyonensis TaxID=430521 RepID=A0ABV7BU35_9PROT|nr:glucokinase [Falsiroseomonas tokyonensis]MBU8537503.1 glucokinase [Falsiroseomonas tokyonensis]
MRALLADIGGTNARFALLQDGRIGAPVILPVAGFGSAEDAMEEALKRLAPAAPPEQAVLALAGPVLAEPVRLTNAPWSLESAAIAARFGMRRVRLVNDFLALAHALPHLAGGDLVRIGGGTPVASAPMLVVGPGTGLGAAGLVPTAGDPVAVPTEGGHIGLAAETPREDAVIAALRARCGRAGAEEALSGRGLVNLHAIAAELQGVAAPQRDAAAIVAAAGTCPVADEALAHFLAFLAAYAGDMALAWGARGGIFIAGGILPRLLPRLDAPRFRAQFEAKPPMRHWMADVPLAVVTHPAPAFLGLAALARSSAD